MSLAKIRIDPESAVPVYRQIADRVIGAVRDGRLVPGRRLPPTRDLARQLGVNRQTVVAAYEHLASIGWVRSHTGRGTFLVTPAPAAEAPPGTDAAPEGGWTASFSRAVEGPAVGGLLSFYQSAYAAEGISFGGSYPARDLLPVAAFAEALTAVLAEQAADVLSYGPTEGHAPLREWIAAEMRDRGAPADASRVLITNGAQQGIDLVFRTFLDRGECVAIEEPTYTGALSVLGSLGARLIPVPMDAEGIRPDLLGIELERHRPKLLYLQPSFHNPTCAVLGEARRREILALAARNRCMVVEDDWASGLRFEGEEPPTLHALDGGRNVIHLSTFSKKLLPGLRIGWVAAPPAVFQRLVALKQIRDNGTSPLLQAALHRFLAGGGLDEHLRRALPAYRRRRDAMLRALEREFPADVAWTRPEGGMFVWVVLPREIDGRELFRAAQARGVLFSQGELFHSNADGRNTLRLTFSAASPAEIEQGIRVLGELIHRSRPTGAAPGDGRRAESMPIV